MHWTRTFLTLYFIFIFPAALQMRAHPSSPVPVTEAARHKKCKFTSLASLCSASAASRSWAVMACSSWVNMVHVEVAFMLMFSKSRDTFFYFGVGKAAWIEQELLKPLNHLWAVSEFLRDGWFSLLQTLVLGVSEGKGKKREEWPSSNNGLSGTVSGGSGTAWSLPVLNTL